MMNWLLLFFMFVGVEGLWDETSKIRGISFFGLETSHHKFMCDWAHDPEYYLSAVSHLGFNMIRIPFSYQYVVQRNLVEMDSFIELCNAREISVQLDFHRVWSDSQQPTPFDSGMTEQNFIDTWMFLLERYKDKKVVIAHNAFNEFVPEDPNPVLAYTRRLFTEVENRFPGRYMHISTGTRWGGNLRGINLEDLWFRDHIYYSIHKYPFTSNSDRSDWDNTFGNVGLPPERIIVGEWGWVGKSAEQVDWARKFISYLIEKKITNTAYWSLSQSIDSGNLFADDCQQIQWENYELLKTLWYSSP